MEELWLDFQQAQGFPPRFKVTRPVLAPAQPPIRSVLWGFFPLACRIWDIRPVLAPVQSPIWSVLWGVFCLAWRSWDVRLITVFYLVPRLGMCGAVPPLLVCLLGIHRDNFTLTYMTTWCKLSAFQGNTSVQKMVATASYEMFVPIYWKTWCHIPEDCNFNNLSLFTFCNF